MVYIMEAGKTQELLLTSKTVMFLQITKKCVCYVTGTQYDDQTVVVATVKKN